MKPTNAQTVGEIIQQLLHDNGLDNKLHEQQALELWPRVVGPGVNRYTVDRYVTAGVMHVKISSASLRNELMMNRSLIIQQLNEILGHNVITEIVFR